MPKRLFCITGSEHDETISAGVYHKCYQRRLRGACAFVQSRRVTQSFGVDEESRHLRTPTNWLCFKCACINFITKFHQNAHAISVINNTLYIRWNFLSNKDDTDEPSAASS